MIIQEASLQDLDLVAPLFDEYRIFYKMESDVAGATKFLKERLTNKESRIFFCTESNVACGFMQLYPSFSSVSMKRIWILNDLYVKEAFRNKSIATLLIDKAKELGRQTGAKSLVWKRQ